MFDFKLTKSGDIEEEDEVFFPEQKITFSVSPYEVQRIKFIVQPLVPKAIKKGEQTISFRFRQNDKSFSESSVQDNEELTQVLLVALRTENNDTYDSGVGTSFYKLKHSMIKDETSLAQLKDQASEIVRDLLPDADVKIVEKEYPDAGYFRYETYVVEVYDDDMKIAEIPII